MAAPLPTGSSIRALPTPVQIDPNQVRANPADAFAAINTGLDLRERLARLGDMQQQIKLEQLKRQSEMAQLKHAQALAEHETTIIPQEIAARRAAAEVTAQTATNELARQTTLEKLGVPQTTAEGQAAAAQNALNKEVSSAEFMQLSPEQQVAATEIAKLGIARNREEPIQDWLDRGGKERLKMYSLDAQVLNIAQPDGSVHAFSVPLNKFTGQPMGPKTDLGTTQISPGAKTQAKQVNEYNDLLADVGNIDVAIKELEQYAASGEGGNTTAYFATLANSPIMDKNGNASVWAVAKNAIGQAATSEATQKMRTIVGRVAASDIKEKYGAVLTPQELANAATFIPTAENATKRPKETIQQLQSLRAIYLNKINTMKSGQAVRDLGPHGAQPAAAPAAETTAPAGTPGETRRLSAPLTVGGVTLPAGTIIKRNENGKWVPL